MAVKTDSLNPLPRCWSLLRKDFIFIMTRKPISTAINSDELASASQA